MPPELTLPAPANTVPLAWRRPLVAWACAALALMTLFAQDWAEMAGQWWNSSTYNHVLLVPPILGWLVWQRWPQLRLLEPSPWWPGLVLFGLALLGWVLGAFAGFSLLRQAGAVALQVACVLVVFGPRIGWALAFPLGYMAFLVPFGDELIPPLQTITARLTTDLVHLSGIPAAIDGVFIDTPAGLFEVAEACSGIKFLIAMIAFGVLAAHVCFLNPFRRLAFLALCVVVPVLANGVRAWGTIAIAQVRGVDSARGIDHVVYGWFFFGIIMALVIGLAWKFFDRPAGAPLLDPEAIKLSSVLNRLSARTIALPVALALMATLALAAQAWANAADQLDAPLPRQIHLPEVSGWHRVDYNPEIAWQPRATGAEHRLLGRYANAAGQSVDVFLALYSGQSEGREAGGFGEGALTPNSPWAWRADGPPAPDGHSERLLAKGEVERLAETYYRTGNLLTGSNMHLKLANISDRLWLRERPTVLLILSSEGRPGGGEQEAAVRTFRQSVGPLGAWVDAVAQVR